jgi:hypothetical protein
MATFGKPSVLVLGLFFAVAPAWSQSNPPANPPAAPAAAAPATPAPAAPAAADQPATPDSQAAPADGNQPPADAAAPDASQTEDVLPDLQGNSDEGDLSIGEIPAVETVELTPDTARKALDAFVMAKDKYKDADLESFENLQDFVDQDPKGKDFETDIKSFGFSNVNEWNVAITTLSFAYGNMLDDQTADIKAQIDEVQKDTTIAQDMRDRMVKALTAMIPTDNNKKILEDLAKDTAYADKLKQLDTEEE